MIRRRVLSATPILQQSRTRGPGDPPSTVTRGASDSIGAMHASFVQGGTGEGNPSRRELQGPSRSGDGGLQGQDGVVGRVVRGPTTPMELASNSSLRQTNSQPNSIVVNE
jgi:hypothetical protein